MPTTAYLSFNPRPRLGAGATLGDTTSPWLRYVSILARASARALPTICVVTAFTCTFQSSPAPRRGRYGTRLPVTGSVVCFNPRPRLGAGATIAHKIGRLPKGCFNPRPRLGAGATLSNLFHPLLHGVSILARASARALRQAQGLDDSTPSVSILARASARALQKLHPAHHQDDEVSILARASARALHCPCVYA